MGNLFTERRIDRLALAADILIVALFIGGFVLLATGGFRLRIGELRLSVRSPERLLLWAMLLVLARRFFGPRRQIWKAVTTSATTALPSGEARLFAPRGQRRATAAVLELAAIGTFCAALTAAVTWPQIARTDHAPDLGDPLFNVWRVSWVAHQLPRDPLHLFDGNIFHPELRTLTYSDATLVSGLIASPMIWAGVHPLTAYTLTFLAGFVLSGVAMYYLVRALTGSRPAGMVAAALFAVYPYRFEHYSHLELQMIMALPLALWGLHRTLASGRLRDGLLTGALLAIQIYSSLYYALFSVIYAGAIVLCLWTGGRRPRGAAMALGSAAALAAVLAVPLLVPYVRSRAIVGNRPYEAVKFYSAEGRDYLVPNRRSLMYRGYKTWLGYAHPERELFPGVLPVALAAAGAWPPLSVGTIAYVTGLAAAFDGSLGANGTLYPFVYRYVPGFRALRVPARFSILVGISLIVLSGYGVARLTARRRPAIAWTIAALLTAAVAVEARPDLELERVWRLPPPIYDAIGADAPAVLLEWPLPAEVESFYFDTRYEYFSVFHWNRLVNGNSGFTPPSYFELVARMREFPSDETIAYLRRRGVQYIAIHGRFAQQDVFARVSSSLAGRSDMRLVRSVIWEGSQSQLYKLEKGGSP
jgi:hypothetical protein